MQSIQGRSNHACPGFIRDQERQAKIAHLQELIDEGIKSGVADLTMADIRQEARVRAELAGDIRIHPVKSHIVIYQIEPSGKILILRVRHGHEDWADDVPG